MRPELSLLSSIEQPLWDEFVRHHREGTFFHLAGWRRVIANVFHHEPYYLLAKTEGAITGVLPLMHTRSRLFGSALISNAFGVYGGPLALDKASEEALVLEAIRLMEQLEAGYLELRLRQPSDRSWVSQPNLYATFRQSFESDPEVNLKSIPRKQRAVIRQSLQNKLVVDSSHDVSVFYKIFSESVRNHGTPVYPRRYFEALVEEFRDCCEVITISDRGRPLTSVLSFFFRNEVLPYYGGGIPAARARGASDFMYWSLMCRAAHQGCTIFDFGRSKIGTGSFGFKKNWGFKPSPLSYEFKLGSRRSLPDINPLNPKYRLAIASWKHLPLPMANYIGPLIARGLA